MNPYKDLLLGVLSFCFVINVVETKGQIKSRKDSFWGLHFDRHSGLNDTNIGKTLTFEMLDSMLNMARPDYIQVDSKGHPGVCSYPTKIGQQAASYTQDPLKLIRSVTRKHNVALFVHHSGVMDINFVRLHPSEGRVDARGQIDGSNTSLWGNYADSLLIPQLKELALDYEIDGAWIDGESWAVYPDYHPKAVREFKQVTGLGYMPTDINDPNYKILLEFNRHKFISYIKHYTSEVKKVAPNFQLCSNWAFSAMMPEPLPDDIKLDFLSGDYDPDNSLNTANWNARCLAAQGKPYDLMAWSFVRNSVPKTAIQLCQEAAAVISCGGGCQMYFRQNADLSFQPASFRIMKDVADFILPRREFCKGITIIPQIGLFYSTEGWKNEVNEIYRPFGVDGIKGIMNAILDGQNSVEILMTHHLKDKLSQYPLIVIPEWNIIESEMITLLKQYVYNGGNLLVIGKSPVEYFEDILGVKTLGEKNTSCLGFDNTFVDLIDSYKEIECKEGTKELSRLYETNDLRFPSGIASTINSYGKGKVAGIYFNLGENYLKTTSPVLRKFLADLISRLFPEPLVKVKGSHYINVVPSKKDDRLLIHFINTSGDHANINVKGIDEIPILQDIQVSILVEQKPKKVVLQPNGNNLSFTYKNGRIETSITRIPIHEIIEITY